MASIVRPPKLEPDSNLKARTTCIGPAPISVRYRGAKDDKRRGARRPAKLPRTTLTTAAEEGLHMATDAPTIHTAPRRNP